MEISSAPSPRAAEFSKLLENECMKYIIESKNYAAATGKVISVLIAGLASAVIGLDPTKDSTNYSEICNQIRQIILTHIQINRNKIPNVTIN